jgi:hypothetical protein
LGFDPFQVEFDPFQVEFHVATVMTARQAIILTTTLLGTDPMSCVTTNAQSQDTLEDNQTMEEKQNTLHALWKPAQLPQMLNPLQPLM